MFGWCIYSRKDRVIRFYYCYYLVRGDIVKAFMIVCSLVWMCVEFYSIMYRSRSSVVIGELSSNF